MSPTIDEWLKLLTGAASGFSLLKLGVPVVRQRNLAFEKIRNFYRGVEGFRLSQTGLLLSGIPKLVLFVGFILAFSSLVILLLLMVSFTGTAIPAMVERLLADRSWFSFYAILAILVATAFTVLHFYESRMDFSILRHWLGVAERTLANRLRREEPGLFRVDQESSDMVAEAIAAKLKVEPDYLSSALLQPHDDRSTLTNELLVGELFEGLMSARNPAFGTDWRGFRPIQDHRLDGHRVLSPQVLKSRTADDVAAQLKSFFESRGVRLPNFLMERLTALLQVLKERYDGDASKLFQFPKPPSFWPAALSLILIVASLALPFTTSWNVGSLGWLGLIVLIFCFLLSPGRWLDWAFLRCRLATRFELAHSRLRVFPVFQERDGMRTALAKFAFEFGIFDIDPSELRLGSQKATLVLLKTGVLTVHDRDSLRSADRDLWVFAEQAIQSVGRSLRGILEREALYPSLHGEHDPYNIVDGFLHRVGARYCDSGACALKASNDPCPLLSTQLCDVVNPDANKTWAFDKSAKEFTREN